MPDIVNQPNCRRKRSSVGKIENDNPKGNIDPSPTIEIEDEYVYDYDPEYYEYVNKELEGCNNIGNFNGSEFEEDQRNTYKELPRNVYCDLVETLKTRCFEQSLLEIWMYNEDVINKLSTHDIVNAINTLERSPYFGFKYDYSKLLGSIKRNKTGHIVSAKAALYNMVTVVDLNKIKQKHFLKQSSGPQTTMDEENIKWQDGGINVALHQNENSTAKGICYFVTFAVRTFFSTVQYTNCLTYI